MSKLAYCVIGPTAAGKTALACELLQHFSFEIISVDSAMIYQGMDIGTAKPDTTILSAAPHHLIDICLPTATYSAAEFCVDATRIMDDIVRRGKIPLLVGGTMMYFRALQQGLAPLPEADPVLRSILVGIRQQHGADLMHAWLAHVDPIASKRIHRNDTQRIQRALEVYLLTEKPLSDWFDSTVSASTWQFVVLGLFPQQRAWLHERIATRFQQMVAQGFLHEVQTLLDTWELTEQHGSMRSVGYRQAWDYLRRHGNYAMFCEHGIAATRQLAKRQLTWLRGFSDAMLFDPQHPRCYAQVLAYVKRIMDNGGVGN